MTLHTKLLNLRLAVEKALYRRIKLEGLLNKAKAIAEAQKLDKS